MAGALFSLACLKLFWGYKDGYNIPEWFYYLACVFEFGFAVLLLTPCFRDVLVFIVLFSVVSVVFSLWGPSGRCGCAGPIYLGRAMKVALSSFLGLSASCIWFLSSGNVSRGDVLVEGGEKRE